MTNFLELAESVKKRLELRFPRNPHGYSPVGEVDKMIANTLTKTSIGAFAVKALDSGTPEDDQLCNDMCRLAHLYNRRDP